MQDRIFPILGNRGQTTTVIKPAFAVLYLRYSHANKACAVVAISISHYNTNCESEAFLLILRDGVHFLIIKWVSISGTGAYSKAARQDLSAVF